MKARAIREITGSAFTNGLLSCLPETTGHGRAMQTDVETFPKKTVTKSFVERQRNANLAAGAVASEITETEINWVLTTVWPD